MTGWPEARRTSGHLQGIGALQGRKLAMPQTILCINDLFMFIHKLINKLLNGRPTKTQNSEASLHNHIGDCGRLATLLWLMLFAGCQGSIHWFVGWSAGAAAAGAVTAGSKAISYAFPR